VARERYDQFRTRRSLAATIDADRAAVDTAKALAEPTRPRWERAVQLGYTEIRAPIGGAPATCC
jgi:hypothetical protein